MKKVTLKKYLKSDAKNVKTGEVTKPVKVKKRKKNDPTFGTKKGQGGLAGHHYGAYFGNAASSSDAGGEGGGVGESFNPRRKYEYEEEMHDDSYDDEIEWMDSGEEMDSEYDDMDSSEEMDSEYDDMEPEMDMDIEDEDPQDSMAFLKKIMNLLQTHIGDCESHDCPDDMDMDDADPEDEMSMGNGEYDMDSESIGQMDSYSDDNWEENEEEFDDNTENSMDYNDNASDDFSSSDTGDMDYEESGTESGEEVDPDRAGIIRRVPGAKLVYKRQSPSGTYEELWIYNIGRKIDEVSIKQGVIAGTDIPKHSTRSEDGAQTYEVKTLGNAQLIHVTGLPN